MTRLYLFTVLITLSIFLLSAREITFSYGDYSQTYHGYGYARPDNYDICIRLDNPSLKGGKIKSLNVPIPQIEGCSVNPSATAWIVTELNSDKIDSSNSLSYIRVETDGKSIEAVFPQEVEIPEEGCYVGYSISVEEVASGVRTFPIAVIDGDTPGGLYFRTTTQPRWDNTFFRMEYLSPMKVGISIELPEVSVTPSLPEKMRVAKNSDSEVMLTLTNYGTSPISTLRYRISTSDWTDEREIEVDSPADSTFGTIQTIMIPFRAPSELGDYSLSLEILEANGLPNIGISGSEDEMSLRVLPVLPIYRPLVEEYTGLWCGNCPMGWVALEEARDKYQDKIIFMTYHVNDILTSTVTQPIAPRSVPTVSVDREAALAAGELDDAIANHIDRETDVDLQVKISWTDTSKSALKASASTLFTEPKTNADYSVIMYLVVDDLSNPAWTQTNYFSGQTGRTGKYWDIFTKGGAYVSGLRYDGIAVICNKTHGTYGHIPDHIYEFEEFSTSEIFELSEGISSRGVDLIRDVDKLRVVAVLLDNNTGKIVNSATSLPAGRIQEPNESNSIEEISSEAVPEYEEYFSMDGIRVQNPSNNTPYILIHYYSNSTIRTSKIIR